MHAKDDKSTIMSAALAFTESYARAMELSASASPEESSVPVVAAALAAHYGKACVAFTHGIRAVFNDDGGLDAEPGVADHLRKFERAGLGYDIFMEKNRIEPVSESSALCWVTWRIRPKNQQEGWSWENVYAYRRPVGSTSASVLGANGGQAQGQQKLPEGYWEFIVSDNEIENLLQRVPNFFQL